MSENPAAEKKFRGEIKRFHGCPVIGGNCPSQFQTID